MGIIQTNEWLEEQIADPIRMCENLVPYFDGISAREIYFRLTEFGMYKPSRTAMDSFKTLKNDNSWAKIGQIFKRYQDKWGGPDIPLFLFPVDQGGGLFRRPDKRKSGVSFKDKLFLFLSPLDDSKEIEALFVHEYHHVCRLNKLNKEMKEYTLLDSLIIEGLAEYAVLKNCGKKYLAQWCHQYSKEQLADFWKSYLQENLAVRKGDKRHDALLYGHGRIPALLGYAAGFSLVQEYFEKHRFSAQLSFSIPAAKFLPD